MDIRLVEGRYKSISTLDWRDIPKFAVITGANGSVHGDLVYGDAAASKAKAPLPAKASKNVRPSISPSMLNKAPRILSLIG